MLYRILIGMIPTVLIALFVSGAIPIGSVLPTNEYRATAAPSDRTSDVRPARNVPGAGGGDDLDRALLQADGEAQASVIAVCGRHQIVEVALVQIRGMRIEAAEHAVDGAADQLLLVDLVDIFGLDAIEDADELVEVAIGIDLDLSKRGGGGGEDGDGADEGERAEEVAGHDVPDMVRFRRLVQGL